MAKSALMGMDAKIFDGVYTALLKAGTKDDTAKKYAIFAVEVYKYVSENPEIERAITLFKIRKGGMETAELFALSERFAAAGMERAAVKYASKGVGGVGGVLSDLLDFFAEYCKANGIEINLCSLAITKVMLDVLSTVALSGTGIGVWAAVFQLFSTVKDVKGMVDACFS